jgi:hypothetical protein
MTHLFGISEQEFSEMKTGSEMMKDIFPSLNKDNVNKNEQQIQQIEQNKQNDKKIDEWDSDMYV